MTPKPKLFSNTACCLLQAVLGLLLLVPQVGFSQKMYWVDNHTLSRANLDGSNVETLVTGPTWGVALDASHGKMYWTNDAPTIIKRADLDGSNVETVVTGLFSGPEGIALDASHGKVYWCDGSSDDIFRADLDGTNVETIVHLFDPLGIALDVLGGKIYWTRIDPYNIHRANLDGSNIETLVEGLGAPQAIALDVSHGMMYWTDGSAAGSIKRASLSGTNVETLVTGIDSYGIALDVDTGKMYWTDRFLQHIRRANLDGSSVETLLTDLTGPRGIALDVPPAKEFVFLAQSKITLKRTKQSTPAGDIHSNGTLIVEKGDPSTYNSNLTAVGKITIQKDNTIEYDVTSATAISNSGTINGTPSIEPVDTEALPSPSYGPVFGPNKTVPSGGSLTLAPEDGPYGIVTVNSGGTLKLSGGEYFMKELRASSSGTVIEIDLASGDEVTINVESNLQLGKEAEIRLLPNGEEDSDLVTFNTLQSSAVSFGKEAYLLGSFNAPSAKVTLVKNTQLRGSICAKEILVERDCLFLHHGSTGSLPGPGDLPKSSFDDDEEEADSYELSQNYPNPFNPSTTISFALPQASEVTLSIFNTNGQLVKKLVAGEMNAGHHSFTWDATNSRGERVASGVYLYVIKAGSFTAQRKLVLMK